MPPHDRKQYESLYQQAICQAYPWFQAQSPHLWLHFLHVLPKLDEIEHLKQKIQENTEKIDRLNTDIKQAERIVSGEEALIGWLGNRILLSSVIDCLQKMGLSTVQLVTLFAITGVSSTLNPFVNPQQRWGVLFILWASVSFVFLTSASIIKITHRASQKHWRQTFWGLTLHSWFVIGCLLFGMIEGLGGGSLAANLIDNARTAANELRDTPLPLLDGWDKAKITAIISLFAYLNILFAVAKGFEVRVLQPNRIRKSRASAALKHAEIERQRLRDEIQVAKSQIQRLQQEVTFPVPADEQRSEIRDLSNQNTLGQNFNGKHPGTYPKNTEDNQIQESTNGRSTANNLSDSKVLHS
jgi:cell division septum initiation protein DivIVA